MIITEGGESDESSFVLLLCIQSDPTCEEYRSSRRSLSERSFSDYRDGPRWDERIIEDGTCDDDLHQCDMLRK